MYNSKTTWLLVLTVTTIAIGALVFVGNGLTAGIAQMSDSSSDESFSGSINSIVDASNAKYIVGGEWTMSIDGKDLTEFSADIDMVSNDGKGAHTHRIVVGDTATRTASAMDADEVQVVLLPTEQSVGGTVLINATGLTAGTNVTVTANDNITALTNSDVDGNLLYALGIAESMVGSVIVGVEDGEGNSGSASLMVTEALEDESPNETGTSNVTASSNTSNVTGSNNTSTTNDNQTGTTSSNATTSADGTMSTEPGDNDVGMTGEIQNNTAGMDTSSDQPDYTIQTEIQSQTYGSEITITSPTISNDTTTSPTTGSAPGPNATDMTNNDLASLEDESSVDAEIASNTTTFTAKADIYSNDELKWEDVDITISITNGRVLAIEIDPEATDDHFGQEPLYGMVTVEDAF